MRLRLLLCSETTILDAASNKVSCINLLDDFVVPQFPVPLTQLTIPAVFDRQDGDGIEQEAEIALSIDDQELVRGPIIVSFQNVKTARSFLNLVGFVVPKAGTLTVCVIQQGETLGRWETHISQTAPEIVQQG